MARSAEATVPGLFCHPNDMLPAIVPSDLCTPQEYESLIRIAHGDDSARARRGDGSFWKARPPIKVSTRREERLRP